VRGPVYYILIIAISFRRTREHIKGSQTDLQLPKVGGKQMETSPKEIKSASAQWIRLYGRAAKNTNNGHNVLKFITII